MDRIMGVLTLRAPTYREIADDPNATRPAGIIVAIVAVLTGLVAGAVIPDVNNPQQLLPFNFVTLIIAVIVFVLFGLIGWFISAWILAFVARWFGGKTNTKEMLRVTGYVEIFAVVGVLSLLSFVSPVFVFIVGIIGFVVAILRVIGYIVGIREAAEFSTGNAIIAAIFAAIVKFLIGVAAVLVLGSLAAIATAMFGG